MRSGQRVLIGVLLSIMLSVLLPAATVAQSSASYRIEPSTFSYGSLPSGGATSSSFAMTLDSVGGSVPSVGSESAGYSLSGGFVPHFLPPKEVEGVAWGSPTSMAWVPDPTLGSYRIYRGSVAGLPGLGGSCLAPGITTASYTEGDVPGGGSAYFYLVTAANLLEEEGPMGQQSDGSVRMPSGACP